ncbi:MAG TPA: tripartite tricarboxylate transporter substrate binding protein [Xanthobacteraceae bacterium]|nr:tripartite tricarboxylate transporter substrate binding protein [Xanthobacteraceae bacterium]
MVERRNWLKLATIGLLTMAGAPLAHAQGANYPDKTVTIISDAGAGASPDVAMRIVAAKLSEYWGQQAVVVNHPGANGSIAARAASEAAPDGYTLYSPALSTFLARPTVAPNLPVMLPRDFLPIGFIAEQPMFIAVDPKSGITSLPQFIDRAKKAPGTLSIAVSGIGRMTHLTGLLLQQKAGIKLIPVPYNGGPSAALSDVASGRVNMIIEGYPGIIGAVNAGQVKLIAVAAPQRLPEFPNLPTVAETIPGFAAAGWLIVAAPVGTPKPIVDKVSADLTKALNDPDVKKKLLATGSYAHAMTPDQTSAFVDKEQKTWFPVLKAIPLR